MSEETGLLSAVWAGVPVAAELSDEAWVAAMVEIEVALARAQARLGVVPESAASAIADAIKHSFVDVAGLAVRSRGSANPVVEFVREVTAIVAAADPEAAEYVHRGSTSQDVFDSAAMLLASRALAAVDADLGRVCDALARLADEHRGTPMAARTLTQHAVPTTFGLKAAGWLSLVMDAQDRLRTVRESLPVSLGGAAGTLAAYVEYAGLAGVDTAGHGPALMAEVARELGLRDPGVPWHTHRTPLVDVGWTVTLVTGALGKIATDVLGATRTEVGELTEPAGERSGVSSAMPQKQNPVLATLVVAAARQAPAYTMMLGAALLAEDERSPGGWQSEWQPLREGLRLAAGAAATAAELVEGLVVHPDALAANLALSGGTIVSERLNVALAPSLGKAPAKALLARISRDAAAREASFGELLTAAPELAGVLAPEQVTALLDPADYLGSADELVDVVLDRHRHTVVE
ncbi:class-II fumarase/aspartase family protein [Nocardioides speluncae]|uniref:class-II fumarase/aspartase family protein n=1 Tax=Nocardioides speluncae TaxID=2670337 RepID=UPI000D698B2A|nr:adenylosuccinate lyase family protein [Nocardioides speluncae]